VEGSAGLGKTRLLDECVAMALGLAKGKTDIAERTVVHQMRKLQRSAGGNNGSMSENCELDPITWDAMVDAMKRHGVPDQIVGQVCADALTAINATPEAERSLRNAQAEANAGRRRHSAR
jgi:hypothetical protein